MPGRKLDRRRWTGPATSTCGLGGGDQARVAAKLPPLPRVLVPGEHAVTDGGAGVVSRPATASRNRNILNRRSDKIALWESAISGRFSRRWRTPARNGRRSSGVALHGARRPPVLLQVPDGSGPEPAGDALDYRTAISAQPAELAASGHSPDDLYILCTGGTTGMPWTNWRPGPTTSVVAVVALRAGVPVTGTAIIESAAARLARYKLLKAIIRVPAVQRSPAGKADYRWAIGLAGA